MSFLNFIQRFLPECKPSKHVDIVVFAMLELLRMPNSFEIYVVSFCRNKFQRYNGYLTLVNNRIIYSTCQVPIQYVYLCIEPPFQTYFIQGITTDRNFRKESMFLYVRWNKKNISLEIFQRCFDTIFIFVIFHIALFDTL